VLQDVPAIDRDRLAVEVLIASDEETPLRHIDVAPRPIGRHLALELHGTKV